MVYRETEHERLLKERTRAAITFATEGKWAQAALLNREILDADPYNVQAFNRLGRALVELGNLNEALLAFRSALQLDPGERHRRQARRPAQLGRRGALPAPAPAAAGLRARVFTGDSGKSAEVVLLASAGAAHSSPGTPVFLESDGPSLRVLDSSGACLGLVPPKVARRLAPLIAGGNLYDGAVAGYADGALRVVLRETYQHPSQRSRVSFPPAPGVEPERLLDDAEDRSPEPSTLPSSVEALLASGDEGAVLELVQRRRPPRRPRSRRTPPARLPRRRGVVAGASPPPTGVGGSREAAGGMAREANLFSPSGGDAPEG